MYFLLGFVLLYVIAIACRYAVSKTYKKSALILKPLADVCISQCFVFFILLLFFRYQPMDVIIKLQRISVRLSFIVKYSALSVFILALMVLRLKENIKIVLAEQSNNQPRAMYSVVS